MANPFLFDAPVAPPAAAPPPPGGDNPFLVQASPATMAPAAAVPAAAAANPFLMEAAPPPPPPPVIQQNPYYQTQQSVDAANPFAMDFGAPPVPTAQPPAQQYYGQYGQYTQVTAMNSSKPVLSTASPPHTAPPPPMSGTAAFGVVESPPVIPPTAAVAAPVVESEAIPTPPAAQQQGEDPSITTKVESESKVEQVTEEVPPPPPPVEKQESITDNDSALPPPPPPENNDVENVSNSVKETLKLDDDETQEKAASPPQSEQIESHSSTSPTSQQVENNIKDEEGFKGIFKNEAISGENEIQPATSITDLNDETKTESESKIDQNDATLPSAENGEPAISSVGAALFGLSTEATETKLDLTAAAAKDDDENEEKISTPERKDSLKAGPPSTEETTGQSMSTGAAIFSDLPTVPDLTSTGASIFGVSEEAAQNTTGATLFGVTAPREARPELGAMSGWDDAFDRKFDTAEGAGHTNPGDPFDPFISSAGVVPTADPFGVGAATVTAAVGFGGDDGFSKAKSFASLPKKEEVNPFLEHAKYDGKEVVEAPDLPLFDEDTSQPLEPFPRLHYDGDGWEMFLRHPPKKKLTSQRYWKKCYVRLATQGDNPCVQLFEAKDSKDPFQELPLQPAYSLSDISHQVFDQYTKIFTLKLQYIFYKERAGIRPGQISKMQKLTGKIGFLAKAVEDADYEGVKEFASDMKKLGVPLEHAPQISELLKLGSYSYDDLKQFTVSIEEKLFKMDIHRDRALTYKTEEVQLTAVDEVYVEQDKTGKVLKQLARVRVFFCSFLTGMPDVELGVNDLVRMGLEVVGRHDILPVPTEQWIRYEDIEFHSIVDKKEFEKNDHIIKFRPPDACYLELMRFRVRPPRSRELPLLARCQFQITGNKVEIRADMMIPYHHTKAWGQVPCEDVAMRIPLPECWIYQFRTEKHHLSLSQLATGNLNLSTRMGSVKSAHRRAGKVKGIERFLGTLETQAQELMETSSGQAKYEHQHKAIVWRVQRLPKQGQGSYTNHEFVCRLQLTSFDQMPETFEKHFYVEFTQPATCVSHTVLRSVSILNGSGEPPEKFSKYLARHEYKLEIEFTEKEQNTYLQAAKKKPVEQEQEKPSYDPEAYVGQSEFPDEDENAEKTKDSDSDSD